MLIFLIVYFAIPIYALYYHRAIIPTYFKGDEWVNTPINQDGYLGLDSTLRKKALDFAWSPGLTNFQDIYAKSPLWLQINLYAISIFGLGYMVLLAVWIASLSPDLLGVAVITIDAALMLLLFYIAHKGNSSLEALKSANKTRQEKAEKLRLLAITFMNENVPQWVRELRSDCSRNAKKIAKVSPEHEFVIQSASTGLFNPADTPPPKIQLSYLFSNGALSIVSGILFDLKETSYSTTEQNDPSTVFTAEETWSHDEFYFSDVTEISFVPHASNQDSVSGEIAAEGNLLLTLSNGSKKQYPATRSEATSLLEVIRERVRKEKTSTGRTEADNSNQQFSSNSGRRFCTQCANPISPSDRFCGACGSPLPA